MHGQVSSAVIRNQQNHFQAQCDHVMTVVHGCVECVDDSDVMSK